MADSSPAPSKEFKPSPIHYPVLSPLARLSCYLQLWFMRCFVAIVTTPKYFLTQPQSQKPTLIKTYPVRPLNKNRIFIPRSHDGKTSLPLYLDLHGGGFAMMNPQFDDEYCSLLCNRFNVLVVSVKYRKSPGVHFPTPTHDVAAIARSVIEDTSLPVDKSRVVIGGFSAGGNLALSAVQLPELQGICNAVVAWYPVTDFTPSLQQKLKERVYRDEQDKDPGYQNLYNHGYIPAGQDLRDPLLSVRFVESRILPEYVFVLGAQYDLLCKEAFDTTCRFAGIEKPTKAEKDGFERKNVRWLLVKDVQHGFTHNQGEREEAEERRLAKLQEIMGEVGDWLFQGPFKKIG